MRVLVGVSIGGTVLVGVGEAGRGVAVWLAVSVAVGEAVGTAVHVLLGRGVGVKVAEAVATGVALHVAVAISAGWATVATPVAVTVQEALGVCVAEGVGIADCRLSDGVPFSSGRVSAALSTGTTHRHTPSLVPAYRSSGIAGSKAKA